MKKNWASRLYNTESPGNFFTRVSRWGLASHEHEEALRIRWCGPLSALPPHLLAHHFLMLFYALPTEERISKMKSSGGRVWRPVRNFCFLCGDEGEEAPADSIQHLYSGECRVAALARSTFLGAFGGMVVPFNLTFSFLAHPPPEPSSPVHQLISGLAVLFFNWALYHLRRRLFMTLRSPPSNEQAAKVLIMALFTDWNNFVVRYKHAPYQQFIINRVTNTLVTPLANKNKKKGAKATLASVVATLSCPPPSTLVYYTDGSASPNPGPAGAGIVLFLDGLPVWMVAVPLGDSTNNIGELYAIGLALSDAKVRIGLREDSIPTRDIFIATDSQLSIGLLLGTDRLRNPSVDLLGVFKAVKKLWRWVADRARLQIFKVKGHSNITGNQMADEAAGVASSSSTTTDRRRILECIEEGRFDLQPPFLER